MHYEVIIVSLLDVRYLKLESMYFALVLGTLGIGELSLSRIRMLCCCTLLVLVGSFKCLSKLYKVKFFKFICFILIFFNFFSYY